MAEVMPDYIKFKGGEKDPEHLTRMRIESRDDTEPFNLKVDVEFERLIVREIRN
jgi:hypothetical protein